MGRGGVTQLQLLWVGVVGQQGDKAPKRNGVTGGGHSHFFPPHLFWLLLH